MLPSDVYVRTFLYLFYTLRKLHYTKALSDQALSLALVEFLSSGGKESGIFDGSSITIKQHHLLGFEIAHLHSITYVSFVHRDVS